MRFIVVKGWLIICLSLFVFWGCKVKEQIIIVEEVKQYELFGLATGLGELADRAYNDLLYNGMINSKMKLGIDFIYASPANIDESKNTIQKLIDEGAKYIIAGGGWHMVTPVDELARIYPEILFVIIDDNAIEYLPNVASILFKQNEASYLAGALAALHSKTNIIGMVGAIDRPIINDFWVGYLDGAKKVKPDIKVIKDYIQNYDINTSPFDNPNIAYEIADRMYRRDNADILFQVASASGMGVFNAANDSNNFAIGVDSDQDHLVPGSILTSVIKRIDLSIVMIIEAIVNDNFENKIYLLGLEENAVSLSNMEYTKDLIDPAHLEIIRDLNQQIIEKKIIVPTTF